jgi:nucleotide-binding universal stress UspA family protein
MKTILVPIDYSDNSFNALHYAVNIAEHFKAKVFLYHVFEVPVTTTEMPVIIMSPEELEGINNSKMNEIVNELKAKHNIEIIVDSGPGYSVEEIARKMKFLDADLTVLGIRGVSRISELVIGSVATGVVRKADHPVLIVPENAIFLAPKKILFASDNMGISNPKTFKFLTEFASHFNCEVAVVNMVDEVTIPNDMESHLKMDYSKVLQGIKLSYHTIEGEDIAECINDFLNSFDADIIVNIPRKHSFLEKIAHESNTKKLAFHTNIPLLALPELD